MEKLSRLLHELIDHAVSQGNKRGELHALVDELSAEATVGEKGTAAKVPAAAKAAGAQAAVPPPMPSVAFSSPVAPGAPAKA